MNLVDALDSLVDECPEEARHVAIEADGCVLTRRGLRDATRAAAAMLRDRWNVEAGDRVAYLGVNRAEELVLLFALARIGAMLLPLNTRLAAAELTTLVAHAEPRVLVVDAAHHAVGQAVLDALVDPPEMRSIDALAMTGEHISATDSVTSSTPVLLVYTSGTTGASKGAVHTHGGLIANAAAAVAAHDLTSGDIVLSVLPLFHVGGLCIQTLPALLAGATVILHARFGAAAWLTAIGTHRPTLSLMVPATLRAVIAEPAWTTADLSSLRVVMAGSSIVPRGLIDAVHARGIPLGQVYGSTETGPVTVALRAPDARRKAGCAGWPCVAGSVRLIDDAGADVGRGAIGEIAVRAPNVMAGYWREPSTTGFRDGWFVTGDLGRHDVEGCLEIVGRSRELIISGGENVFPAEIEAVLLALDGVVEAAVIGIGDATWGEVPIAFVVVDARAALDEPRVMAAFDGRLARYKHPKRVLFVERLPRNVMGKVQGHLLREQLRAC